MSTPTSTTSTEPSVAELLQHPAQTRKNAARVLQISVWTLDRYIRDGLLPSRKFGNNVFIPTAAILAAIGLDEPDATWEVAS